MNKSLQSSTSKIHLEKARMRKTCCQNWKRDKLTEKEAEQLNHLHQSLNHLMASNFSAIRGGRS